MGKLLLVRHGESLWNIDNLFTGWADIYLTLKGIEKAKIAGKLIKKHNIPFDICFSSYLKKAISTALIILDTANLSHIDLIKSWKLNDRNYGAWQGKNKVAIRKKNGDDLFRKIRSEISTAPPALNLKDKRHPRFDNKYKNLDASSLPVSESLEDTRERFIHFFFEQIVPQLVKNKTVLVSAHSNSIRALIIYIEHVAPKDISKIEVQSGVINNYLFNSNLNLKNRYQLN